MAKGLDIVVLAAGQGTRMKSSLPKVLHPVAGRPMIQEVLSTAQALSGEQIVVVVGHGAEVVREVVGAGVDFALQAEQLGTGHAVLQALPALAESASETVLVLYGDSPLIRAETLQRALEQHSAVGATVTLLSFLPQNPTGYGRILRDDHGEVLAIVEERDATEAQRQIRESNSGFMIFEAEWLRASLPQLERSAKGEYYLTDLTASAVSRGRTVQAIVIDEREVLGVNDRSQLAAASNVLWQRRREHWMAAGVTMVDPATVWIESEATIGAESMLHPNVYIRGTTTIGANCTVGAFSILENATVAGGSTLLPFTHLFD